MLQPVGQAPFLDRLDPSTWQHPPQTLTCEREWQNVITVPKMWILSPWQQLKQVIDLCSISRDYNGYATTQHLKRLPIKSIQGKLIVH
jgi:hypothetical protein